MHICPRQGLPYACLNSFLWPPVTWYLTWCWCCDSCLPAFKSYSWHPVVFYPSFTCFSFIRWSEWSWENPWSVCTTVLRNVVRSGLAVQALATKTIDHKNPLWSICSGDLKGQHTPFAGQQSREGSFKIWGGWVCPLFTQWNCCFKASALHFWICSLLQEKEPLMR